MLYSCKNKTERLSYKEMTFINVYNIKNNNVLVNSIKK